MVSRPSSDLVYFDQFQEPLKRKAAETNLQNFKSDPNVLGLSRFILENSKIVMVQFFVANLLKEAIVKEYTRHALAEIVQFSDYLIQFVIQRPELEKVVKEQLFLVYAITIKLHWIDAGPEHSTLPLDKITPLFHSTLPLKKVGFGILFSFLEEFCSYKSTSIGAPVHLHIQCRKYFQDKYLLEILKLAIQSLEASLYTECAQTCIGVLDSVLCWEFLSEEEAYFGSLDTMDDEESKEISSTSSIPMDWKPYLIDSKLVAFLCQAYMNAEKPELRLQLRNVIIQLASLKHLLLATGPDDQAFIQTFLQYITLMVQSLENQFMTSADESEVFGVLEVMKHFFKLNLCLLCSQPELPALLQFLYGLVSHVIRQSVDNGDTFSAEMMDPLSDLFCSITKTMIENKSLITFTISQIHQWGHDLFILYVNSKMDGAYQEEAYFDEPAGQDDKELHEDQLICMSTLGRFDPVRSISSLGVLLGERVNELARMASDNDYDHMSIVNEQLHWLILISGHLLTDSPAGERPCIAKEFQESPNTIYPVIELSNLVFRVIEAVTLPKEAPQSAYCSPLVAETLFWFCDRWYSTYLFQSEGHFALEFSKTFVPQQMLEFLWSAMLKNLALFQEEVTVIREILNTIDRLVEQNYTRKTLFANTSFQMVLNHLFDHLPKFPSDIQGNVVKTVARAAFYISPEPQKLAFFNNVSSLLQSRFHMLFNRNNFQKVHHYPNIKEQVTTGLQILDGLALSADIENSATIFNLIVQYFDLCVYILNVYKDSSQVELTILNFLSNLTRYLAVDDIPEKQKLYLLIQQSCQCYANTQKGWISNNRLEEDADISEGLICLLSSLANLMRVDFGHQDWASGYRHRKQFGDCAEPVLISFESLLPMLVDNLLEYDKVVYEYLLCAKAIAQYFPDALAQWNPDILEQFMTSIVDAFESGITSRCQVGLEILESLLDFLMQSHGLSVDRLIHHTHAVFKSVIEGLFHKPIEFGILEKIEKVLRLYGQWDNHAFVAQTQGHLNEWVQSGRSRDFTRCILRVRGSALK